MKIFQKALLFLIFVLFSGPLTDLIPVIRGTLPMNHFLVPYGFKEIPNLAGKAFLVTGANGWGTSKLLATHGGKVVMACRSLSKCETAKQKILTQVPTIKAEQLVCDVLNLSSLKDVNKFSEKYVNSKFDSLILNAGVMYPPFELTEDGFETTWGVNHVAHFLLTRKLIGTLNGSKLATIVSVASNGHYAADSETDISKFNDPSTYNIVTQYGRSKLANILLASELSRKFPQVSSNSLNPGGVRGDLYRHLPVPLRQLSEYLQDLIFWSEEQSALTVIGCALNPLKVSGKYFVPVYRQDPGSSKATNITLAKSWYDQTENILKQKNFL